VTGLPAGEYPAPGQPPGVGQSPRAVQPLGDGDPACPDGTCVTCSDSAVPVTIARLLPGAMAVVDTGYGQEEVSVALVTVQPGDRILVHAGEAIALLPRP
jgi:hydrogenase expression/formation protein HypC